MLLFKYFKKSANDILPDPNCPLNCLLVYPQTQLRLLLNREVSARRVSAESAASGEMKRGPYNR